MPHAPAMTEASPGNESVMKCDEEGKKKKKGKRVPQRTYSRKEILFLSSCAILRT